MPFLRHGGFGFGHLGYSHSAHEGVDHNRLSSAAHAASRVAHDNDTHRAAESLHTQASFIHASRARSLPMGTTERHNAEQAALGHNQQAEFHRQQLTAPVHAPRESARAGRMRTGRSRRPR